MKTSFTLLFSFLAVSAFAQQNFVPGYYITLQTDTVTALIHDQNWVKNPTFIKVKTDQASTDVKVFSALDIRGFGLATGDVFETHTVYIDKSPHRLQEIIPDTEPLIVKEAVFLRALVKGNLNLFFLKDEKEKDHFFLQKTEESPYELINRVQKFYTAGEVVVQKQPLYKGALLAALTDCPAVYDNSKEVSYNLKPLKKLVEDYNQCISGSKGKYAAPEEKVKFNVAVLGGVAQKNLNISGKSHEELVKSTFQGMSYTVGASFIATMPRSLGKWSFVNEVMYKPLKAEGAYEVDGGTSERYRLTTTNFDLAYAGLNTLVRYKLRATGLMPYVNVGLANNFMVYDKSNQVVYRRFYNTENTTEQKPLDPIRKYEQAVVWGFGVEYNKLLGEVKVEHGNGFSEHESVKTAIRTIALNVGYIF